jgi:hypothetical protein
MKLALTSLSIFLFTVFEFTSFCQTIPVGTPIMEEAWRRMQIKGELDSNSSFTIRPIHYSAIPEIDSSVDLPCLLIEPNNRNSFSFPKGKGIARLLPVTLKQQYNSHHPYGWNDGSMIQAKGYQNQLSFGLYSKIGILSIQLQPEFVYAQNSNFSTFPGTHSDSTWKSYYYVLNRIDDPEKYGNGSYAKFFPGQSSIRLNYKKLSLGVSTENLWWGPGIRNSLVMSNTAPGFQHITFNTTSPLVSPIGSFEWQVVSGILKNSDILPGDTTRKFEGQSLYIPKIDGDRYLNGMVITWQPKWTKGLFLGASRMFYLYKSDVQKSLNGYLPIVANLFKGGKVEREDSKRRDQMLSVFFRLILPKEKAELYAEYGRNDHSSDLRDLLVEPEHARAYIIGFKKLFETPKQREIELLMELTHLHNPPTSRVRELEGWYTHYQVRQGYTNLGQVIGAGIGPGSNSQTLGINWIKGIEKKDSEE